MDGFINLDKPAGISSARAVDQVKRLLPRKTKIGHAGTLDPFATGVLVLLVGKATRQCERLMDRPKQYEAIVKLGATTATDDPEAPERPFVAAANAGVTPDAAAADPAPPAPIVSRHAAADRTEALSARAPARAGMSPPTPIVLWGAPQARRG